MKEPAKPPASVLNGTVSSPASKSRRVDSVPVTTRKSAKTMSRAGTANGGATIYVKLANATCATGTGAGTQASPYCSLQDGVSAAASGDTIDVSGSSNASFTTPVTVTTSNISIVGVGTGVLMSMSSNLGASTLTLRGVTGVTVSNMGFVSPQFGIAVVGSSGVTLSGDYLDALSIDGASSGVSVTRSFLAAFDGEPYAQQSTIASGASGITFAGDVFAGTGIQATGVTGLDITGNTIQRGCNPGVDIEGTSTSVFLENDLIENGNDETATSGGGGSGANASWCIAVKTFSPSVIVAAGSTPGVTTDYNDFYTVGGYPAAPLPTVLYDWSGTSYPTLAQFQSAVPTQAAHDTFDTIGASLAFVMPGVQQYVNGPPIWGSPAIGSANPSAPGALSSDFNGVSPFNSRGAIQYVSPDPELALTLTARDTSGFTVFFDAQQNIKNVTLSETIWWGDGSTTAVPSFSGLSTTGGVWHTYSKLGTYTIKATVTDNAGDTVTNTLTIQTAGTEYVPYGPTRVLDTRNGTGTQGSTNPVAAGATLKLRLAAVGGIPANVSAVALNLTVAQPTAGGYITAYPSGGSRPTTSSVNFTAGQTVANMAVVPVGADGTIELYNGSGGTAALVADVSGYFITVNAQGYTAASPARLLDTRNGTGGYPYATVRAGTPARLQIAGVDGIPAGVTAVALNLTVAGPSAGGYVAAYPDGQDQPTVSNVNFTGGQTVANAAIVPVGADGSIDLAIAGGPARLIADVYGYFSPSGASAYVPAFPYRVFDSRQTPNGALLAGYTYLVAVAPEVTDFRSGVSAFTGAVINTTVTRPIAGGYLTVFPDTSDLGNQPLTVPPTSTLDFTPNATVADLALPALPQDGTADFYNGSGGSLQLIVDVSGYFIAG